MKLLHGFDKFKTHQHISLLKKLVVIPSQFSKKDQEEISKFYSNNSLLGESKVMPIKIIDNEFGKWRKENNFKEIVEFVFKENLLTPSQYASESKKNIGFQCFLDEKGLKLNRGKEDHFYLHGSLKDFKNLYNIEEEPEKIKEVKEFVFNKNFSLNKEDFIKNEEDVWKQKWDNYCTIGNVDDSLITFLNNLQIPSVNEKNITNKTLLISTPIRIERIKKIKKISCYELVEMKENEIILKNYPNEEFSVPIYLQEQIEYRNKEITKDSVIYICSNKKKQKDQLVKKLLNAVPEVNIIESIHIEEDMKDKEGKVLKTKKGKIRKTKRLNNEIIKTLSHIIVFKSKKINYISKISEKHNINIVLETSIDFKDLYSKNNNNNVTQNKINEENLLNNQNNEIEFLSSQTIKNKSNNNIRMDEEEILSRISFPILELIDQFKLLLPYLKKDFLKNNSVIRIGFIDHADHANGQAQWRNENIAIVYDPNIMESECKPICNK